jgi:hypothetical protein
MNILFTKSLPGANWENQKYYPTSNRIDIKALKINFELDRIQGDTEENPQGNDFL